MSDGLTAEQEAVERMAKWAFIVATGNDFYHDITEGQRDIWRALARSHVQAVLAPIEARAEAAEARVAELEARFGEALRGCPQCSSEESDAVEAAAAAMSCVECEQRIAALAWEMFAAPTTEAVVRAGGGSGVIRPTTEAADGDTNGG